jgi:hypothetical protein
VKQLLACCRPYLGNEHRRDFRWSDVFIQADGRQKRDGTVPVTDEGTRVCVDPGGNGAIMNVGEGEGPGPPQGRGSDEQLVPSSRDGQMFIG